jgi:hypothetical protein
VDEATWMGRSIVFVKNLFELDLLGTYRKHHPGVTVMWLNGIGFVIHWVSQYLFTDPSHLNSSNLIDDLALMRGQKDYPLSLYVLNRILQAFITSGCMVVLFLQARQLLGHSIALLGLGLLLFEPFFLAYQRLLLTDVLQINLLILAFTTLLLYWRGDGMRLLWMSAILMGLATATKITALFILPAVLVSIGLIELGVWQTKFPRRGWWIQIRDMTLWGSVALATIFAIWPALWIDPSYVLEEIITGLQAESERGFLFFLGHVTDSIGVLFYPIVLLYRLSPLLLIGMLLGLVALTVPRFRQQLTGVPELTALLLASVSIVVLFSLSGNKLDRYILPAVPGFAFLAAAGWLQLVQSLVSSPRSRSQSTDLEPSLNELVPRWQRNSILSLVTLQLALMAVHYPYYLTYFNPLLGGGAVAQNLLMIGNGEGLDRAAQWLNQLPNARNITVGSAYGTVFAPYFQGQTLSIRRGVEELEQDWLQKVHYLVFYINQFQRELPSPEILNYFTAQEPLHTVRLHGIDYAQIYPGTVVLPEQLSQVQIPQNQVFANILRLRGYDVPQPLQVGQPLTFTLYWEVLQRPPRKAVISLSLTAANQQWLETSPLLDGLLSREQIVPGLIIRDLHQISVPATSPSGTYTLAIGYNTKNTLKEIGQLELTSNPSK